MKTARWTLIGFDARVADGEIAAEWNEKRRKTFLLEPSLLPRSVDTAVWPSVFDLILEAPTYVGPMHNLWESDAELRRYIKGRIEPNPFVQVAIAVERSEPSSTEAWSWLPVEQITPSSVDDSWDFLGFDVADRGLVSGLSNCGYSDPERDANRELVTDLNERHLFASVETAHRFRKSCDARVPEHAPFYVYGIWRIR